MGRADFRTVLRRNPISRDNCFTVFAISNGLRHARLGVTVSKRVAGRAVARNRIKRLVRESFRQTQWDIAGLDLVVVARPHAAATENPDLRLSLAWHWKNVTIRCKS